MTATTCGLIAGFALAAGAGMGIAAGWTLYSLVKGRK